MVALVRNNTVHLQPVVTGRDYGANVEIREGLQEGDLIVVNPGDSAKDGARVTTRMLTEQDKGTKTRNSGQSSE
jgi:multidrug efflux pump subunit AcrA (membrane-fusion protein)